MKDFLDKRKIVFGREILPQNGQALKAAACGKTLVSQADARLTDIVIISYIIMKL